MLSLSIPWLDLFGLSQLLKWNLASLLCQIVETGEVEVVGIRHVSLSERRLTIHRLLLSIHVSYHEVNHKQDVEGVDD